MRVEEGTSSDPANPTFELDPIGQEIVTCTVYNSFNYDPVIASTRSTPRPRCAADLQPPAVVTSDYTVTNPGNTPLADVTVVDDRCGNLEPVPESGPNIGDANEDGLLDPGEEWEFVCPTPVRLSRTTTAGGTNVENTAVVTGTDPNGEQVTDDATDDVDIYTPAISLDKTVEGDDTATITVGDEVTYEYVVTNTGNLPLGGIDLGDDQTACSDPTLVDDGDGDAVLDLGESGPTHASRRRTVDVVNTADVTGIPLDPTDTANPFPGNNPPVTDTTRPRWSCSASACP